jgi:hypothetical protein
VSRGLLPNKQSEYKRLGEIIGDARLAGLVRWDRIVDRTRNRQSVSHWSSPASILDGCAFSYRIDKWKDQPWRPWVWIEKEALVGVIERVCRRLDAQWFACRGYVSLSEMWASVQAMPYSQKILLIHLGDHDPSGIDMTRDIKDRLKMFGADYDRVKVQRIALNMNQIEELNPPENPAKDTDCRFANYAAQYGESSWELDALPPDYIAGIIEDAILGVREEDKWAEAMEEERLARRFLRAAAENWPDITSRINDRLEEGDYDEPQQDPDKAHRVVSHLTGKAVPDADDGDTWDTGDDEAE